MSSIARDPGRRERAAHHWAGLPANLKGAALLVLAYLLFTVEVAAARMLGTSMATEQVVLVRSAAQMLVVIPFVLHSVEGLGVLRTRHLRLHLFRGALSIVGLYAYFYSFANLPLAAATTIGFTKALFLVVLAQVVLGEVVRLPRWIATLAGFAGVLLVARPGLSGVDLAILAGLVGAVTGAGLLLVTKLLSRHESPLAIMVYVALITTAASLPAGIATWKAPDGGQWLALALIGVFGPMGQYVNILAFRVAEASSLAGVDYVRLIFSAGAGYLVFSEIPDAWTIAGALVIVASTLFLTRHESRAARLAAGAAAVDPLSEPLPDPNPDRGERP
ncbi:DMT family transporter [Bosea sp. BK604]|uniref:DMT family transporter n=1 Tax=Bosea sp. BK604 TaxID=2512180 RepID=UPI0010500218|nr:DMT family transporter [Bosea sp. BK604]TCR60617.1 drug/metabolite transporter (DMT)-like permease [Bosea sp. BK604]